MKALVLEGIQKMSVQEVPQPQLTLGGAIVRVLANGVCAMGGVAEAKQGYVMVKGGGVPALNVIGYNRQVEWDELLNRLKAVIAGHSRPVIQ